MKILSLQQSVHGFKFHLGMDMSTLCVSVVCEGKHLATGWSSIQGALPNVCKL